MKTKMKSIRRFLAANTLVAALLAPAIWAAEGPPSIQWQKSYGGSGEDSLGSVQPTSDGGYILAGVSTSGISGNKTSTNYGGYDGWLVKLDANGDKVWDKSFGGDGDEFYYGLILRTTSDGGYILGGDSKSGISGNKTTPNFGGYDYWVVKLDANGDKLWERTLGGSGDDRLKDIQQTSDGGYVIGGDSESGVSGNKTSTNYGASDYWVVKLDADGNKVWDKSYGGTITSTFGDGNEFLTALYQTSDGDYILAGTSSSGASGNKTSTNFSSQVWTTDYWVVKVDPDGNIIWDKSFGGDNFDSLGVFQRTSDGGYILGGASYSGVSGNKSSTNYGQSDYWIVMLDGNGEKVWDKSFGGNYFDFLNSIQQTSDGGYILAGQSASPPSGNKTSPYFTINGGDYDAWIVKINANGNVVWDKSFGGTSNDGLVAQQTSGGYLLYGWSSSDISGNRTAPKLSDFGYGDAWLLKLDLNGDKIWEAAYGGSGGGGLGSPQETSSGLIFFGGSSSGVSGNKTSPNYGGGDIWVLKLEGPPRITAQPQSRSVAVGKSVTFNVTVAGVAPLNYQWLFNGTNIAGATGPTLTLTNTTHTQAGFYSVIVTNRFGTVTSTRAQLTFNFLTLKMYAGLTIDGEIGQTYRIEYLPAIEGQNSWQALATVTLTNTPYLYIDREAPISIQRFYRALLAP